METSISRLCLEANPQNPYDFAAARGIGWRVNLIRNRQTGGWQPWIWPRLHAIEQSGCGAILLIGAEACRQGYDDRISDDRWRQFRSLFLADFEAAVQEFTGYFHLAEMWNEPNSGQPAPPWWDIRPARLHELQEGAHAICQRHGVPLISAAMLTIAENDGTPYWQAAFPDGDPHADLIGAHVYIRTDRVLDRVRFLLDWTAKHLGNRPLAITELGSRTGPDIPIEEETGAVLDTFPADRLALVSKFCIEDFDGEPQHYGIRDKAAWPRFWALAQVHSGDRFTISTKTAGKGGTGGTMATRPQLVAVVTGTGSKRIVVFQLTGQDGNACVGDPYGNNEASAARWMMTHPDGQKGLAERIQAGPDNFEFYYILPELEVADRVSYQVGIPRALKLAIDLANARPDCQVDVVHWHTDSAIETDDQDGHFGILYADEGGKALGQVFANRFSVLYDEPPAYFKKVAGYGDPDGYYALGAGQAKPLPGNMRVIILEAGTHGKADAWRWYLDHVDAVIDTAKLAAFDAAGVPAGVPAGPDPLQQQVIALEAENQQLRDTINAMISIGEHGLDG